MDKSLEITTHISWEDYKKFNNYILTQSSSTLIILISIGFAFLWSLLKTGVTLSLFLNFTFFILLFALLLVFFMRINAKRAYKLNSRLTEFVTYKFDTEWIESKGQSFESKMSWDKIYQVVESKTLFLIYQTKMMANIIPKKDMTTEQIEDMRNLLKSIPNLKLKLIG